MEEALLYPIDPRPESPLDEESQKLVKKFAAELNKAAKGTLARIASGASEDIDADRALWQKYYARLRAYCARYHLPNPTLGGNRPFGPTPTQKTQEQKLYAELDSACAAGRLRQQQCAAPAQEILSAMGSRPQMPWKELAHTLAQGDGEKETYWAAVLYLQDKKCLEITADAQGETCLKAVKKKARKPLPSAAPTGAPVSYGEISSDLRRKARYTVAPPESLDAAAQTAVFPSLDSEDSYVASLTACTCVAYSIRHKPCKHMVALAYCLGMVEL